MLNWLLARKTIRLQFKLYLFSCNAYHCLNECFSVPFSVPVSVFVSLTLKTSVTVMFTENAEHELAKSSSGFRRAAEHQQLKSRPSIKRSTRLVIR